MSLKRSISAAQGGNKHPYKSRETARNDGLHAEGDIALWQSPGEPRICPENQRLLILTHLTLHLLYVTQVRRKRSGSTAVKLQYCSYGSAHHLRSIWRLTNLVQRKARRMTRCLETKCSEERLKELDIFSLGGGETLCMGATICMRAKLHKMFFFFWSFLP